MSRTVRLTLVPNEGEAEIMCRMLRAEGVPCMFRSTDFTTGGADGAGFTFGGWREILVNEDDLERARELIEPATLDGSLLDE